MTKSHKNIRKHFKKSHKQKGGTSKKIFRKFFISTFFSIMVVILVRHSMSIISFTKHCNEFINSNGETIAHNHKLNGATNCPKNTDATYTQSSIQSYKNQCQFIEIIKLINNNFILKLAVYTYLFLYKNTIEHIQNNTFIMMSSGIMHEYTITLYNIIDNKNEVINNTKDTDVGYKSINNNSKSIYDINNNYFNLIKVIAAADTVIRHIFIPYTKYADKIDLNIYKLLPGISSIKTIVSQYEPIKISYSIDETDAYEYSASTTGVR